MKAFISRLLGGKQSGSGLGEPVDPDRYQPAGPDEFDLSMAESGYPFRSNPDIVHVDGVPWYDAAVTPKLHRCWPQTIGRLSFPTGSTVHRCACGSLSYDLAYWMDRNSR